jgi:hypothetical protein
VLADWLQDRGDPWGTLLTLTGNGHREEAAAFAKKHAQRLNGGFGGLWWKDGFVDGASLKAWSRVPARSVRLSPVLARNARTLRETQGSVIPSKCFETRPRPRSSRESTASPPVSVGHHVERLELPDGG